MTVNPEDFLSGRLVEWLIAIGTIGAAAAAVWIANKDRGIHLRVNVGGGLPNSAGTMSPVSFSVTNIGRRPATIVGFYCEFRPPPFFRRATRIAYLPDVVMRQNDATTKLPAVIKDGESVSHEQTFEEFCEGLVPFIPKPLFLMRWTTAFVVSTMTGDIGTAHLPVGLRLMIAGGAVRLESDRPRSEATSGVKGEAVSMFWKSFKREWLPGLACSLIGAFLGWAISYKDTQTQIHSMRDANGALMTQDGTLHVQNGMLQQQNGMLQQQNEMLVTQGDQLRKQAGTLASILRTAAAAGRDARLALDRHGNITIEGKAVVDSGGNLLTDEKGNVLTTDGGIPLSAGPSSHPN